MEETIFFFDGGKKSGEEAPEKFYHGLVPGLLVESTKDYVIKFSRESGYGRYGLVMESKDPNRPSVIMEFKVFDREDDEKKYEGHLQECFGSDRIDAV